MVAMVWEEKIQEYKFMEAYHNLTEDADPDLRRRLEILSRLFGNAGWIDGNLGFLAEIVVEDTVKLFGNK